MFVFIALAFQHVFFSSIHYRLWWLGKGGTLAILPFSYKKLFTLTIISLNKNNFFHISDKICLSFDSPLREKGTGLLNMSTGHWPLVILIKSYYPVVITGTCYRIGNKINTYILLGRLYLWKKLRKRLSNGDCIQRLTNIKIFFASLLSWRSNYLDGNECSLNFRLRNTGISFNNRTKENRFCRRRRKTWSLLSFFVIT